MQLKGTVDQVCTEGVALAPQEDCCSLGKLCIHANLAPKQRCRQQALRIVHRARTLEQYVNSEDSRAPILMALTCQTCSSGPLTLFVWFG